MTWLVISYGCDKFAVIDEEDLTDGPAAFDCEVKFLLDGHNETEGLVVDMCSTRTAALKSMDLEKKERENDEIIKDRKRVREITSLETILSENKYI